MRTFTKQYGNINALAVDLLQIERSMNVKIIEDVIKDIRLPNKVYFTRVRFIGRQRILAYTRVMQQTNALVRRLIPYETELRIVERIEHI